MSFDEDFDYDVFLDDDFLADTHVSLTNDFQPKAAQGKAECANLFSFLRILKIGYIFSISGGARLKKGVVKCVGGGESILRMRRKIFRPRGGVVDNNTAVNSVQCRKYLRRRDSTSGGKFKLFAFPTFDKCDSLLFLPTSFASLFNSGDVPTLSKLIYSRAAKDCKVNINVLSSDDVTPKSFVKFQELIIETHPDAIMCVHSTKVIGNQIHAMLYIKFTASNALYNSISRTKKDAVFGPLFSVERAESLKHSIIREDIPDDEREQFHAQMETDLDLMIYKSSEMVLTLDDTTKKLTHLGVKCRLTAIEAIPRTESQ